jgi:myo-inositol-hexaphosphate 3-phosphohydrolase
VRWRRKVGFVATLLTVVFLASPPLSRAAVSVCPTVETAEVHSPLDAADDSAIWIHPTDTSLSTLIGTDKTDTGGLNVYDLSGAEIQFKNDGRLNNDDVRYSFPLGFTRVGLVGVTNRVAKTLDFYKVEEATRTLTKVGAVPVDATLATPRGFAMYHSPVSGKYYGFVTDSGKTLQYELDGSTGQVTGRLVRRLATISNATEGLVADDELGRLYIAEEDIGGVWRFGAEPTDPTTGVRFINTTENGGPIVQDVKGLSMYYASGGRGYVLAASQSGNSFHVIDRQDNHWVGEFKIVSCNGIDGVSGTDGIDVTNFNLGPRFPNGFFVAQDHVNDGGTNQNHKLVRWETIANAFNPPLVTDATWDPRTIGAPPPAVRYGYPRPAAAVNLRVPLAIAYGECTPAAANEGHGGALALPACNPVTPASSYLTAGTLDANGQTAAFGGWVKLAVVGETPISSSNGDQADVQFTASVADVRNVNDLSDYTGQLGATVSLRITDANNGTAPETASATLQDVSLTFPVQCQATADAAGGACTGSTSADTLAPGTVVEGKRAVWELGPVTVSDGGADGILSSADNAVFARQGIFVP